MAQSSLTDTSTFRRVPGVVLSSKVVSDSDFDVPAIEYSYDFDGVAYRGNRVAKGPLFLTNWPGPAERLVSRYPVGATISVFVDPKDPHRAYLQPRGYKGAVFVAILLGAIVIALIVSFARSTLAAT